MKPQLSDVDRAAVVQNIRHTRLVDMSRRLARIVKHTDPDAKTRAARTRLEHDLPRWLKHYGAEAFDRPWSPDHLRVLARIEAATTDGGLFALAMSRGGGKSTILKWV